MQGSKVKSILVMGKAGSGKTTIIRECARVMSLRQNLWVVDTSNEICGDGDLVCAAQGVVTLRWAGLA
jgi:stage III sporulation protein SpoIIIAA